MTTPPPPGPPVTPSGEPRVTPPATPPPRQGFSGRVWLGIFVGLVVWNLLGIFGAMQSASVEVPYSVFITEAKAGNVGQITINGQAVQGTFRRPVSYSAASAAPSVASASPGSAPAAPVTYVAFTTVVPPLGDPELL